jgi:hypothetical protein
MDTATLWRAALLQLAAVAILSIALALLLPKSFFEEWGWVTGPLAWLLCAGITARILGLPRNPTVLGAVLAGLPSVIFVVIELHWAGAVVAVGLFACWCGWLRARDLASGAPSPS